MMRITIALLVVWASAAMAAPADYFVIEVVDQATGRGVPLVELRTTSNLVFMTDSAGLATITEPDLLGRKVFFTVKSHGYEFPADGFGQRGKALDVQPGQQAKLKIKRQNIAERLYRITGAGIYRDSVLAGRKVPIAEPLLNAQVVGQDSTQCAVYRGKIYWFWGDTARLSYSLGHFGTAGATSELPASGGLNPAVGINLKYFANADGFSRPMCNIPGGGMKWIDGLMVLKDEKGTERLVTACGVMKSLGECTERTLLVYNDAKDCFDVLAKLPLKGELRPAGQSFRASDNGVDYFYFATAYPTIRVRADFASVQDVGAYEGWTCLKAGGRFDKSDPQLDRDGAGKLVWAWKRNTDPVGQAQQDQLLKGGKIKADECWYGMKDDDSPHMVRIHYGSVRYNAYRKRFIMIAAESGGKSSYLGETWYAEAERPEGPWRTGKKIITHDRYSLYNPVHHPFFDEDGGRIIYLEGTYASTFSRQEELTPRYDYNQVMYRLDLGDARLTRK